MRRSPLFPASIALASLAAGPIFVASTGLAVTYLQLPHAVIVDSAQILRFILFLIPAIFFGFILSFIPNLLGTRLLLFTGTALPLRARAGVWIGAGALFGAAIAGQTGAFASPAYAFGLIFTSACCAAICRLSAFWD